MQRILNKLAWRNLPIAAKAAMVPLLQLLFILGLLLGLRALFVALRVQLETGVNASVEMRSISQDLQLSVEQLQRLEARLVEQRFGWAGFDRVEQGLRRDHAALTGQLEQDANRISERAALLLDAPEMVPVSVEVRTIQTSARDSEESFAQIMELVTALAWPDEGALQALQQQGERLQQLSLSQGSSELVSQVLLMRSLEATLIETGAQVDLNALRDAGAAYLSLYEAIPPGERQVDIPAELQSYLDRAAEVAQLLNDLQAAYRASQLAIGFSREAASRLGAISEAQRAVQIERINAIQDRANTTIFVLLAVSIIVGLVITFLFARDLTRGTRSLLNVTRRVEAGDLSARVDVRGEDEFSQLGAGFNAMAAQLQDLIGGLERRVAERTRDLSITAEIGHAAAAQNDPRNLMDEVVDLIQRRFGFYHAQVFLVDEEGSSANLAASTGRAGRLLLARRHALPVGSQSVIGQVTVRGEPVIVSDTAFDPIHRPNELLPDTRAEMALPMRIGDRVIGALDVQSAAPNVFDEDVVAVFQIMADELAVALENARLYAQLDRARSDIEQMERHMTVQAWEAYRQARSASAPLGYTLSGDALEPHHGSAPLSLSEAIRSGRLVQMDGGSDAELGVPIKVRGEVIGAFGFSGAALRDLSEEDFTLVEAVANRVGLALENLRLIEETARRAEHEQILNEITAKIVGAADVDQILQTTVKELGRVLRAPQTSVRLHREGVD